MADDNPAPVQGGAGLVNPASPLAWMIGGGDVANMTLEDIKRRRAIAMALASRNRGYPKTLGEGMTYLGEAIGDRFADERLSSAEKAMAAKSAATFAGTPAAAGPAAVPTTVIPRAAVPTAPLPGPTAELPPNVEEQRNRIAALYSPEGVAQQNPTEGAPQAPRGIQLASANTGTMSDAPPPGFAARPSPLPAMPPGPMPVEPENPPTPTDIQPMPTMVAQAGGGAVAPRQGNVTVRPPGGSVAPPAGPPAVVPGALPVEDEYVMPKPAPPAPIRKIPETDLERRIRETLIVNPEFRPALLAREKAAAERKFNEDREVARYNGELQHYNTLDTAYQTWLTGRGTRQDEARKRRFEMSEAEKAAALQDRLGGRKVEDFIKDFKAEHTDTTKMVGALGNIKEAENAIRAGAITGYGANARVDWARLNAWLLSNNRHGDVAAQTQILKSNLDSMVGMALAKIQPGDTRVTEGDLKMASGLTGNIEQQREALLKLMAVAKQTAYDKINAFEERRHTRLGGTPLESDFPLAVNTPATSDSVKKLIENKSDPHYIERFDANFGPGTAKLEIDRARRAEEAARRR